MSSRSSSSLDHLTSPSFVSLSYRNLVFLLKFSIHYLQYPNSPNSCLTCLLLLWARRESIPWTLSGSNFFVPSINLCPKYFTSFSTNCNLDFETFSPLRLRKFNNFILPFLTDSSSFPAISKSSTY